MITWRSDRILPIPALAIIDATSISKKHLLIEYTECRGVCEEKNTLLKERGFKMKKFMYALFVFILVFSVLTGCASGNGNEGLGQNASANQDKNVSANKEDSKPQDSAEKSNKPSYWSDEPAEASMFVISHPSWPYDEKWPIWNWAKEATNITIKGQVPSGEVKDAYNLMVASGEISDIVFIYGPSYVNNYGDEGAYIDFNKYLDKMPNLKKYWEENPGVKALSSTPAGANYMVANSEIGFSNQRVWMYREDIFKKHNLETPQTWDELYQVAKQLKKLYPESYPFNFRSKLSQVNMMASSFETSSGIHTSYDKSGKAVLGAASDEFRKLVEQLSKFNKEGLIPPDWLSLTTKQWVENAVTNKGFISLDYIGRIEYLNNKLGDGNYRFMAPPAGEGGKQLLPDTGFNISGFAINANSKNLEAAIRYVDFLYSEIGREMMSWGIEGVTYNTVNGKKQFDQKYVDFPTLRKDTGLFTNGVYGLIDIDAALSFTPEEEQYVYREAPKYLAPIRLVDPAFTPEEEDILSTLKTNIDKHISESIAKFIVGERPISEWDQYVQELKKINVDRLMDIYQKAYDRQ
jgi:putative aldouronate transport system substrate-binding protein